MTNTSSRVLRDAEQGVVTPITWRAAASTYSPKAKINPTDVMDVPSRHAASERDPNGQPERDHIEQQAYHRGFTEGKAVGREQAGAQLQSVLDQLGRSLATLSSLRSGIRG